MQHPLTNTLLARYGTLGMQIADILTKLSLDLIGIIVSYLNGFPIHKDQEHVLCRNLSLVGYVSEGEHLDYRELSCVYIHPYLNTIWIHWPDIPKYRNILVFDTSSSLIRCLFQIPSTHAINSILFNEKQTYILKRFNQISIHDSISGQWIQDHMLGKQAPFCKDMYGVFNNNRLVLRFDNDELKDYDLNTTKLTKSTWKQQSNSVITTNHNSNEIAVLQPLCSTMACEITIRDMDSFIVQRTIKLQEPPDTQISNTRIYTHFKQNHHGQFFALSLKNIIDVFDSHGKYITHFNIRGFSSHFDLDANDLIYVATDNWSIQIYAFL